MYYIWAPAACSALKFCFWSLLYFCCFLFPPIPFSYLYRCPQRDFKKKKGKWLLNMLHSTKKMLFFLVTWILEVGLRYSFSHITDINFTFILFLKHIPVHIYPCGRFSRRIPSQQWCDSTNCSISTPLKTICNSCSVQHKKNLAVFGKKKKKSIFLPTSAGRI